MRILVTAASKHGATSEIADSLGRSLSGQGHDVSVAPIEGVSSLDGYDAVIVGSAVYMGRWLVAARAFVEAHELALSRHPTWLFSSGPVGDPLRPVESEPVDAEALAKTVHARGHRVFAGRVDKRSLGLAERTVMRAVHAHDGDYRDWDDVGAWATEIGAALRS